MEDSILKSTKKMLGLSADDHVFDMDVILLINSAFSTLDQLGVGPRYGFMIEDESATWSSFLLGDNRFNSVKTYVYLKVRMTFDPPSTSFVLAAMQEQVKELEFRLNVAREFALVGDADADGIIVTPLPDGNLDGGNPSGTLSLDPSVTIYDGGSP